MYLYAPTYNTARKVADIIKPLVGKSPHHLNNSSDLLNKLKGVTVDADEELISFDVTALFTSVPVEETIKIIRSKLQEDPSLPNRTSLSVDDVTNLLQCCLTTTYFVFQGKFYTQTEGAAMGSPVSPLVANLFMENFEIKALASFSHPIKLWARYVDDTICVLKRDHIDEFTDHLNSQHPAIKFTSEREKEGKIAMLDILMSRRENGSLKFAVYRKPTHTDHYLQYNSHQPLQHKLGVIRTLRHRSNTVITEMEDKEKEDVHLKRVLSISGYPQWAWQLPSSKTNKPPSTRAVKGAISMPYIQGITEPFTRYMRALGAMVHPKPHSKLRDLLVAPKDPINTLDKTGVVYQISCGDCPSGYVGETSRALRTRLKEHTKPSSPVGAHAKDHQHRILFDQVKILDSDQDWFSRGVREAIQIATQPSDLNRDRGRHTLPRIYRSILHSRDSELLEEAPPRE